MVRITRYAQYVLPTHRYWVVMGNTHKRRFDARSVADTLQTTLRTLVRVSIATTSIRDYYRLTGFQTFRTTADLQTHCV